MMENHFSDEKGGKDSKSNRLTFGSLLSHRSGWGKLAPPYFLKPQMLRNYLQSNWSLNTKTRALNCFNTAIVFYVKQFSNLFSLGYFFFLHWLCHQDVKCCHEKYRQRDRRSWRRLKLRKRGRRGGGNLQIKTYDGLLNRSQWLSMLG